MRRRETWPLNVVCPSCHARPGHECKTRDGKPRWEHELRYRRMVVVLRARQLRDSMAREAARDRELARQRAQIDRFIARLGVAA